MGGMGFLRVKLFQIIDKWLNRFTDGLLLVHRGIWLGLLDHCDLQNITDTLYKTDTMYYTQDYNLSGFWIWEAWAMSRYFGNCSSFLVAAAGGGREVIALAKRDFHVDAFECNEELVRFSQGLFAAENIESKLILSAPDMVPSGLGEYDGIIVGWGAYTHISGRDNRVRFLQQLRQHAHSGAPILLSFFTRHPQSKFHSYKFTVARIVRKMSRRSAMVELGDDLTPTFMHRFSEAEITDELVQGGFQLIYFDRQPFGHAVGRAI